MIEVTAGGEELPVEWSRLRPGQLVETRRGTEVLHRGVVEEVAPEFQVAWIRGTGSGARRMLSSDDVVRLRG